MTISDNVITTNSSDNVDTITSATEPKLYAGKFKTVDDLVKGYNNAAPVFEKNKELEQKVHDLTTVPEDYQIKDEHKSIPQINELVDIARAAGTTQAQFDKMISEAYTKTKKGQETFEALKGEIPKDQLLILEDHVKRNYPTPLQKVVLDQLIVDNEARRAVLTDRNVKLNSEVGAFRNIGTADEPMSKEKLLELGKATLNEKGDTTKAREAFIKAAQLRAAQIERGLS